MKKIISLIMVIGLIFSMITVVSAETVTFANITPAEGSTVYEDYVSKNITLSADITGAETVEFFIDDVSVGTPTKTGTNYSLVYSTASVPCGKKNFTIKAVKSDGSISYTSVMFYLQGINQAGLPKTATGTTYSSKTLKDFNGFNGANITQYGWAFNGASNLTIESVAGKSGETSDKAVSLYITSSDTTNNSSIYFFLNNFASTIKKYGRMYYSFDIKPFTNTDTINLMGFPLWFNGNSLLTKDGRIGGTNVQYKANEWMHFEMIADLSTPYPTWNVWLDETQIVTNGKTTAYPSGNGYNMVRFTFIQESAKAEGEKHCGFAFDNAQVYHEIDIPKITSTKYSTDDGTTYTQAYNNVIPKNTTALKLTTEFGYLAGTKATDIEITADGQTITPKSVSCSGTDMTIKLSSAIDANKISIKFKDTLLLIDNSRIQRASSATYYCSDTDKYLGAPEFSVTGGTANAKIFAVNGTGEQKVVTYVIAAYDSNGLLGISYENKPLNEGYLISELKIPQGATYVKLLMLESEETLKPLIKVEPIQIQ